MSAPVEIPDSLAGLTVAQQYAIVEKDRTELKELQRTAGSDSIIQYHARVEFLTELRDFLYKKYTDPFGKKTYA